MIKPKAINCNYSVGRFCFAHLQNFLIGVQIRKTAKTVVFDWGQNQELRILLSRCTEGCNPFVPEVQEVANILLGSRDKVPGRSRVAAIAQLRDVSSLSTGYFLTIKAGFMAASLQFSARTQRKETTK